MLTGSKNQVQQKLTVEERVAGLAAELDAASERLSRSKMGDPAERTDGTADLERARRLATAIADNVYYQFEMADRTRRDSLNQLATAVRGLTLLPLAEIDSRSANQLASMARQLAEILAENLADLEAAFIRQQEIRARKERIAAALPFNVPEFFQA